MFAEFKFLPRICYGLFGGGDSSSTQNVQNTTNTTDQRVGAADQGTALVNYGGGGVTKTDTTVNNTQLNVTDDSAIADGTHLSETALAANAAASAAAIQATAKASADANAAVQAGAAAALDAQTKTANTAINAVQQNSSDAIAFARTAAEGYIDASAGLNTIVGNLATQNQAFDENLTGQVLQHSQSEDAQNFQQTLDLLKKLAYAAAAAVVIYSISK